MHGTKSQVHIQLCAEAYFLAYQFFKDYTALIPEDITTQYSGKLKAGSGGPNVIKIIDYCQWDSFIKYVLYWMSQCSQFKSSVSPYVILAIISNNLKVCHTGEGVHYTGKFKIMFFFVGYLMTMSVLRYTGWVDRIVNECGTL
jgi:hypothetical protein